MRNTLSTELLALECIGVSRVKVLETFLNTYKRGLNESFQRPEKIMKLFEKVTKRLRKRGSRADKQMRSSLAE